MRFAIVAVLSIIALPCRAEVQYPAPIPPECNELAQREGFPTLIENKTQAVRAKLKLYRLSNSDPLVKQCRDAVARAIQAARSQ